VPAAPLPLLSPAAHGGTVRAEQRLTLSRDGTSTTLQAFVEVAPGRVTLVGAGALGQRVLDVDWDGATLRAGGGAGAAAAEQALRDLQLVAWPLAALRQATAGTGYRVEEPRPSTRQLWRGDALHAEIHYAGDSPWDGRAWLVSFEPRYTLALESRRLP
jgi:hypothetical protein